MQDILKAQKEEFDSLFDEEIISGKFIPSVELNKIFDWRTSSIHQLLQALIEREELELDRNFTHEELRVWDTEWNKAKQDTINNLKTLQDSLK